VYFTGVWLQERTRNDGLNSNPSSRLGLVEQADDQLVLRADTELRGEKSWHLETSPNVLVVGDQPEE
jgi:hypothetical protein